MGIIISAFIGGLWGYICSVYFDADIFSIKGFVMCVVPALSLGMNVAAIMYLIR